MASKQNTDNQPKTLDGVKMARNLEEAGMDRRISEAIVDSLMQTVNHVLDKTVSKEEFAAFRAESRQEMAEFRTSMECRFSDFKDETRRENAAFRDETRQELAGLRQDNADLRKEFTGLSQKVDGLRVEMHKSLQSHFFWTVGAITALLTFFEFLR